DADPDHKDVFIEVDAMNAPGLAPTMADLDPVLVAFANAPVQNPDQTSGIRLHVVIDESDLGTVDFPLGFDDFDLIKKARFGTPGERNDADSAEILEAKRQAFRYCLFANTHSNSQFSGLAEQPGNDFMVTMGGSNWFPPGGTSDEKAGTFMHELGHTLGLDHGGRDLVTGPDGTNFKPNYYSIMNYTWQIPKSWMTPFSWPLSAGKPGFAAIPLPDLDELALRECVGFGVTPGPFDGIVVPHNTHNSVVDRVALKRSSICCGGVDWNNDGTAVSCSPVAVDLNHLCDFDPANPDETKHCMASPGQLLRGHEDWSKLIYNFRNVFTSPDFADGVHQTIVGREPEMTFELHQYLDSLFASQGFFRRGDANGDGELDLSDAVFTL
ncbi:MAG: hypothetical protein Q7R41_05455, partial [Phycisphaerales bacterium]|nr:hypothetical protein [Phycisphaerales bacterium]